ncbi:BCCT family transporter [Pseudonocardia nigra]|uniref:BCCT family transporter n=1 Tax=Pseudonocardia nigra TaxID=1921578 RepID=UPI001C5D74F1|nr:BCCT family transporter [Pseudonocardia nigra]
MTTEAGSADTQRSEPPRWRAGVDMPVALTAGGLTVAFLVAGLLFTDQVRVGASHIYTFIAEKLGWIYVLSTAAFVFFLLAVGISRFGRIRLGGPDSRPEYSTFSWISMMFALGVGIGLIFYGAAEPALLYTARPPGGPPAETDQAAIVAMQYSLFHWCLHPWAFFGVAGLALAYAIHNKDRPSLVTSTLRPLLGKRVGTGSGRTINTWVIVTTLVGNAVTLGLGTLQIVAGLGFVAGVERSNWVLIVVVVVLTIGFLFSAVAGVDRGIKRLADFNSLLAIALMLFLFVLGPIAFILDLMSEALGGYLFNFIPLAFETNAFDEGTWMQNWTIFFWAWRISWAPYVGSFLAKISRGRTIREYMLGVLIAPSAATVVWFAVVGGTALNLQFTGERDIGAAAAESPQAALFAVLEAFPASTVTSIAVIILAGVFFVSGADAGAIVLGTFASRGNPEPQKWLVLVYGSLIGFVALALLIIGGLDALQWGALVAASPFVLVLIAMCVGFALDVRADVRADPNLLPRPTRARGT